MIVVQPVLVKFTLDPYRHTVAAVKAAESWLAQWTAPNNLPGLVLNRQTDLTSADLNAWRLIIGRGLKATQSEHLSLLTSDFAVEASVSEVKSVDGELQFWPGAKRTYPL